MSEREKMIESCGLIIAREDCGAGQFAICGDDCICRRQSSDILDYLSTISTLMPEEAMQQVRDAMMFAAVDLKASLTIIEGTTGNEALGIRQTLDRLRDADKLLAASPYRRKVQ